MATAAAPATLEQLLDAVAQGHYEPAWPYPSAPPSIGADDPAYVEFREELTRWQAAARALHRELLCEHARLVLAPLLYPQKFTLLYSYAWDMSHSEGLSSVLATCAELCDLVQSLGLRVRD